MGLREQKAERTRAAILEAALTLYDRNGFDQTTMEQVAEAAQIGIATLYRYFPTKDLLLIDPIVRSVGGVSASLERRPADEPLDLALGHALHEYLTAADERGEWLQRLRAHLDRAPGPRARLWDLWHQERTLLENTIAVRAGADPGELWVGVAAHTTMMIVEMALDLRRSTLSGRSAAQYARELVHLLSEAGAVIPRLP